MVWWLRYRLGVGIWIELEALKTKLVRHRVQPGQVEHALAEAFRARDNSPYFDVDMDGLTTWVRARVRYVDDNHDDSNDDDWRDYGDEGQDEVGARTPIGARARTRSRTPIGARPRTIRARATVEDEAEDDHKREGDSDDDCWGTWGPKAKAEDEDEAEDDPKPKDDGGDSAGQKPEDLEDDGDDGDGGDGAGPKPEDGGDDGAWPEDAGGDSAEPKPEDFEDAGPKPKEAGGDGDGGDGAGPRLEDLEDDGDDGDGGDGAGPKPKEAGGDGAGPKPKEAGGDGADLEAWLFSGPKPDEDSSSTEPGTLDPPCRVCGLAGCNISCLQSAPSVPSDALASKAGPKPAGPKPAGRYIRANFSACPKLQASPTTVVRPPPPPPPRSWISESDMKFGDMMAARLASQPPPPSHRPPSQPPPPFGAAATIASASHDPAFANFLAGQRDIENRFLIDAAVLRRSFELQRQRLPR